jgi:hypothetical protein
MEANVSSSQKEALPEGITSLDDTAGRLVPAVGDTPEGGLTHAAATPMGTSAVGFNRVEIIPFGKGRRVLCIPPGMASVAMEEVKLISDKIVKTSLTPGVEGGITIFVEKRVCFSENSLRG